MPLTFQATHVNPLSLIRGMPNATELELDDILHRTQTPVQVQDFCWSQLRHFDISRNQPRAPRGLYHLLQEMAQASYDIKLDVLRSRVETVSRDTATDGTID